MVPRSSGCPPGAFSTPVAAGCIVAAYATNLLVVERLFPIVKPKLMKLSWFAHLWTWLVSLRVVTCLKAVKEAIYRWISSVRRVWF